MNTYIYLIRHGEVENPKKIMYGRLPHFGLSEFGRSEVAQTATFLQTRNIDMIITSPLQRAVETGEIIQKTLGLPTIQTANDIIEVQTSYQGTPFATLDKLQSEIYLKPLAPTDETVSIMARRMETYVWSLFEKYPGKRIAIVTHGDPSMCLQAAIDHWPLEFASIRKGEYIKHAEVWEITRQDENNLHIEKIFKPRI